MNGVIGFADLLLKTELSGRQRDFLETIHKSANNLLSIIDDILDFSKIEAGKMVLEQGALDFRACVEDVLAMLAPAAHAKGLELVSLVYSDVPYNLVGDPVRVRQVLTNLINNAIKFTESGSVVVRVMVEKDEAEKALLCVNVTDTGIGLSPEEKRLLFQAFSQADTTTTRRFGGTGLGLVISKKLVEKMGGDIGLDSAPGQGSTFWFTLSCKKSPDLDTAPRVDRSLAELPILLYEPWTTTALALSHHLQHWGLSLREAKSPEQLLAELASTGMRYCCIVVGVNDPAAEEELLREVIAMARERHACPVLVLLGSSDHAVQARLAELGAAAVLSKPVTRAALFSHLRCLVLDEQALDTRLLDKLVLGKPVIDDKAGGERLSLPPRPSPPAAVPARPLLAAERARDGEAAGVHILAVDDNPANLKLLTVLLEDQGLTVTQAENGLRAVKLAREQDFDLVFMDIQMPEMDGIEALKLIRQDTRNAKTPVVAITAHALAGEKEAMLSAGMNDYVTKPISGEQLEMLLRKWVRHDLTLVASPRNRVGDDRRQGSSVIDWEQSLSMAGGKSDLASDLLSMLIANIPVARQQIVKAHAERNQAVMRDQAHKFHGATCYCGVPRLKWAAAALETALKTRDVGDVEAELEDLLAAMADVEDESGRFLAQQAVSP